jgi:hypothetical protein
MSDCQHEDFQANVGVHRLTRGDDGPVYAWIADVEVKCSQCGLPFEFPGLANGISSTEARVSINGQKMSVPLKPADKQHFEFFPGFDVRQTA